MAVSTSYRSFVEDQLRGLPGLLFRPMFGELGVYADGLFFALVADDVLYFKVDRLSKPSYLDAGSGGFQPIPGKGTMQYYEVPPGVLEDREQLHAWAGIALEVARRGRVRAKRKVKTSER